LATRAPHAEQPREPATAAQPPADRILPEPVALRSLVFTFHHRSIFSRPFETTTQLRCITLLRRVVAELAFHSQAEPDGCSGRAIAAVQFNELLARIAQGPSTIRNLGQPELRSR